VSIADSFKTFLSNIAVDNADVISLRYEEITAALNKAFRDTESKTANSLQVGSYGRWTAIKGISDLDMLYVVPARSWDTYDRDGGQSNLLSDARKAIQVRYPNTEVFVDRLVVRALYTDFHIEVQPVFEDADGNFIYPDTIDGGSWKTTKPRLEIQAMSDFDDEKNKNLRRLCKMARAWKNKHGLALGGLLIDTLAHNFLRDTGQYDNKSYLYYDEMCRDFFLYLGSQPDQDRYAALGSGQHVKVKKKFQKKANKAHGLCLDAIAASGQDNEYKKWRKVFGRHYPAPTTEVEKAFIGEGNYQARDTEQHIEDRFPIDIRYTLKIDCDVSQSGYRPQTLRDMIARAFPLMANKSLTFKVVQCTVPGDFEMYWKVLNRGPEAVRRDNIRGQIVPDGGYQSKSETTNFRGNHVVDCYAVQHGVVIASDRVHVPIQT
jgi:hypothetical protein